MGTYVPCRICSTNPSCHWRLAISFRSLLASPRSLQKSARVASPGHIGWKLPTEQRRIVDAGYTPNDWQVGQNRQLSRRNCAWPAHLGCDTASGRHEEFEGHPGDQQERRSADLLGSDYRLVANLFFAASKVVSQLPDGDGQTSHRTSSPNSDGCVKVIRGEIAIATGSPPKQRNRWDFHVQFSIHVELHQNIRLFR